MNPTIKSQVDQAISSYRRLVEEEAGPQAKPEVRKLSAQSGIEVTGSGDVVETNHFNRSYT